MATTSNFGIVYPTVAEGVTPLADKFAVLAQSIDDALVARDEARNVYYRGLAANKASITSPRLGDRYQETDGNKYVWRHDGSVWVNITAGMGSAKRTANQSIPNSSSSYTKLALSADVATGVITFNDSNDQFTVNADGYYLITARVAFATSNSGKRNLTVFVNGSTETVANLADAWDGKNTTVLATGILELSSGDLVDARAWQNSGAALNSTNAFLSIVRVGVQG